MPEEVRKSTTYMPIYPFERAVFPRRFASPFVAGGLVKAPGGIGDTIEKPEGEKIEGGGTGRKRSKRNLAATSTENSYVLNTRSTGFLSIVTTEVLSLGSLEVKL